MDKLEEAAKLLEIKPEKLFQELCDTHGIEKRRRVALLTGYTTELYLPPFIELSCVALITNLTKGGI